MNSRFGLGLVLAMVLGNAVAIPAQSRPGGPAATSQREVARQLSYGLRDLLGERLCGETTYWVIGVDMSHSTVGAWNEAVVNVLGDWVNYAMVAGDMVRLVPFDVRVDPDVLGGDGQPLPKQFRVDGQHNDGLQVTVPLLLKTRKENRGTSLLGALRQVTVAMTQRPEGAPNRAVGIVLSDRKSNDDSELDDAKAAVRFDVPGVRAPGSAARTTHGTPLPFDVRDCTYLYDRAQQKDVRFEMFVSETTTGEGAPTEAPRCVPPPLEVGPTAVATPPPDSRWRRAVLLVLALIFFAAAATSLLWIDVRVWSERAGVQPTVQRLEWLAGGGQANPRRCLVLRTQLDPLTGGVVVPPDGTTSPDEKRDLANVGVLLTIEPTPCGAVVRTGSGMVELAKAVGPYETAVWTNRLEYARSEQEHVVQCRLHGRPEPFWPEVRIKVEAFRQWVCVVLVLGLVLVLVWWADGARQRGAGPVVPPRAEPESLCAPSHA